MNEEMIEFVKFITGHDRETSLQLYVDFLSERLSDNHKKISKEKQITELETNCTCKDSTGWTDKPCCNICGKQVEGK